jgi:hypothetical protein
LRDLVIVWDDEDDRDGNYWHICVEGHGLTVRRSRKCCGTTRSR